MDKNTISFITNIEKNKTLTVFILITGRFGSSMFALVPYIKAMHIVRTKNETLAKTIRNYEYFE